MRMSQKEKEKELVPILQDNKCLAKLLLSVKDQIKEKEKKMRNCIPKGSDVGVPLCWFKKKKKSLLWFFSISLFDCALIWDTYICRTTLKGLRKRSWMLPELNFRLWSKTSSR